MCVCVCVCVCVRAGVRAGVLGLGRLHILIGAHLKCDRIDAPRRPRLRYARTVAEARRALRCKYLEIDAI